MERQLPDVVAARTRPPERLFVSEPSKRSPESGAMPPLSVERLIDDFQ
jgi:hypothetical protein